MAEADQPPLFPEDRPEFERLLDAALNLEQVRLALYRARDTTTPAQLRARALRDAEDIALRAAPEYQRYVALRAERALAEAAETTEAAETAAGAPGDAPARPPEHHSADSAEEGSTLGAAHDAGLVPLLAVIATVLSWLSALVLWLLGLAVHAADGSLGLGHQLTTAARSAVVIGVLLLLVDAVGLLLTWRRDAAAAPDPYRAQLDREAEEAHAQWREALTERGLVPYLLGGVAPFRPAAGKAGPTIPVSLVRLRPRRGYSALGYSSPGFTSPGVEGITDGQGRERPHGAREEVRYTSPGFTSPGVEGITDGQGREIPEEEREDSRFLSPGYTGPDFTSPNYRGPRGIPPSRFLPNFDEELYRRQEDAEGEPQH